MLRDIFFSVKSPLCLYQILILNKAFIIISTELFQALVLAQLVRADLSAEVSHSANALTMFVTAKTVIENQLHSMVLDLSVYPNPKAVM